MKHGWYASAQTFWYDCIYNITVGTGAVLQLSGGLLGCLMVANLVMLLSAAVRNGKIVIIAALAILYGLRRFGSPYGLRKIVNPIYFGDSLIVKDGIFVGETLIPCFCIVFIFAVFEIIVMGLCIRAAAKRYRIGG